MMKNILQPLFSTYKPSSGRIKFRHRGRCELAFSGMAPITVERSPGDPAIVAFPAILPLDDLDHRDLIGTGLHREDIRVADLAFKSDAMKPVGKDHGGHLGFLCLPVHDDITVLGTGDGTWDTDSYRDSKECQKER
jgi:hypothetical protein